jgi:hypothetical protein
MSESWDENASIGGDEYGAEWASIVDDALAEPREGLGDLLEIVERMRADLGGAPDDDIAAEGVEPELARDLGFAHEVRRRLDAGDDVPDADVEQAVQDVVDAYETLQVPSEKFGRGIGAVDPAAADQLHLDGEAGATAETDEDL